MQRLINHYRASFSGLPRSVWYLASVLFINRSGSMAVFFMALYLTRDLDFTIGAAGRMVSIYGIGSLAGSYLGGWLCDKWGAMRVQFRSLVLAGVGLIILGYIRNEMLLMGYLLILGMVAEAFRPASTTAMASIAPPEQRARSMVLNRLAANLGIIIGPAVGGVLARIDYIFIFWMDGITCLLAAGALWLLFIRKKRRRIIPEQAVREMISPFKDRIFLFILLQTLFLGILFFQIFNSWSIYLRDVYGLYEDRIGLLLALNGAMIVLIEMPIVYSLQKRNPYRILALGTLLLYGGFAILPFGRGFAFVLFTVLLWSMGEILALPILVALVANRATDQNRGKYLGLYNFTFALAMVIGPVLGTRIYEVWGANTLWFGLGIFGLFVSAGFLLMYKFEGFLQK